MPVSLVAKQIDPAVGNTALSKTYAAVATYSHSISGVSWSYNADPAAGDYLAIVEDAEGTPVELFRIYLPNKGPGYHPFPRGLTCTRGKSLTVTLTNGNSVAASLNVLNYNGAQ